MKICTPAPRQDVKMQKDFYKMCGEGEFAF